MNCEIFWRNRYEFFKAKGYSLRPRYQPGWKPSWLETKDLLSNSEDYVMQIKWNVLDASKPDGTVVFIKMIDLARYPNEKDIALFLSECQRNDPHNHCVPIIDNFPDNTDPHVHYIVMPLLRAFNEPDLETVEDVVDFVDQTLEGLAFMHRHNVAHRDCANRNIMMDGRQLARAQWHPMVPTVTLDYRHRVTFNSRSAVKVRYYFIDFGFSTHFQPGQARSVVGSKCRDPDPPELSDVTAYDPFKLDIFLLGNVFKKDIYDEFECVEFLLPLINSMVAHCPNHRPNAQTAVTIWKTIRNTLHLSLRKRLPRRTESIGERVLYDVVSSTSHAIHGVRDVIASWTA
ncbi:kinase-like domain-containing protein [Phlebopus sp. FC_14]|nr:kinase-like domain-containing protein [Phlebopus sp. FC_14]